LRAAADDRVSGPAVVYVRQVQSGLIGNEGSFAYVRVVGADGNPAVTKRLSLPTENDPVEHVALRLNVGDYRLVSFQRICSGNCGLLGPPVYRCDYPLEVGGETVALVVRLVPRRGCDIEEE
jgi:hypothetical protein